MYVYPLANGIIIIILLFTAYSGKVLGIIQSSHVGGGGLKPGSTSVAAKVNTDLRRVLASSGEEKVSSTSTSESKSKRSKKGSTATATSVYDASKEKRGGDRNGSKQSQPSKLSPAE